MKKTIEIPKGCRKIGIEIVGDCFVVTYESGVNEGKFCQETGQDEEPPGVGDFSIFWDREYRNGALCANFVKRMPDGNFLASDGYSYENAVKFRDYKQYLMIRGIYED